MSRDGPCKIFISTKWIFAIRKTVPIFKFGRRSREISAWPRNMAGPKQQHRASIYQKCIETIQSALQDIKKGLRRVSESYRKIVQVICPETVSTGIRPHNYTVVWSLATFILFIVLTCVAVRVTTTPMRIGYASSSTGLFLFLAWIILADLTFSSKSISFWSIS